MAFNIVKITVDGVTFVSCELTGTDQETAAIGVAEATVTAAPTGATVQVTAVASPTSSPNVGPGRPGIDYTSRGRLERCAICGFVYHIRTMVRQRGAWVCREDYDQVIPIRGRTGKVPSRRWSKFGGV